MLLLEIHLPEALDHLLENFVEYPIDGSQLS
jgi:hypothetical protein